MVTENKPQQIQFFNWYHAKQSDGKCLVLEPHERCCEIPENDIVALKYSNKTLIALTARQFVYLYRRDELLDNVNGSETQLKFCAIRPRINDFEVSGKKLVIEDIKVIMGSDIYIMA